MKEEEDRHNLKYVLKEDETAKSHVSSHAQLRESGSFQHAARVESKESLVYDDGQEQKEVEEYSKEFKCHA
jgi:hypothetical protein